MIKAMEDSKIGDLFGNRKPFFVPTYQRAYAWDEDEVRDYVSDINKLKDARERDPENPSSHFFGGIVSIEHFVPNSGDHKYELVDGQQRLATFLIAFSLLEVSFRSLAGIAQARGDADTKSLSEARARFVMDNYVKYTDERGEMCQRLTLSKSDRLCFEAIINDTGREIIERDSHKRLKAAKELIYGALFSPILSDQGMDLKEKFLRLDKLKLCLAADCHAIHIVSDNRREAYRLFSVLNDRGKSLTDGDLLRARTLEALEDFPEIQDVVEHSWDVILGGSQAEIDQFLRSYYASMLGKRPPSHDLFDGFVNNVLDCGDSFESNRENASALGQKIARLENEWKNFQRIAVGEWPYDSQAARAWDEDRLRRLVVMQKHDLSLPLLLAAKASLDEDTFAGIVEVLDRVAFRYISMARAHPGSLMNVYYSHCRLIRDNPAIYRLDQLKDELCDLIDRKAPDALFVASLNDRLVYGDTRTNRTIKHFLTTLESYARWLGNGSPGRPSPDKTRVFDVDQYSLEHIYPRNAEHPVPNLEEVKETLGNLCILSQRDNNLLDDKPFDEKKDRYRDSHCAFTEDVADKAHWTRREVDGRFDALVGRAMKVFKC